MPSAKRLPLANLPSSGVDAIHRTIDESQSNDIVIALVGHAGAGATTIGDRLKKALEEKKYDVRSVKMSKLIAECAEKLSPEKFKNILQKTPIERTVQLQNAGNFLRSTKGQAFTAGLAIREIRQLRRDIAKEKNKVVFVIDNLKNPTEVDALRKVYGRAFYLVSVVCGPRQRHARLISKYKGAPPEAIRALMDRDEAETEAAGQQVRKTIKSGDYFINNEPDLTNNTASQLEDNIKRFSSILLGDKIETPTRDERGLYAAWTASLRSSCLSRQVGAALLDPSGRLIATGVNDVPKFGGGLYEEGDQEDFRCFAFPDSTTKKAYCRNDSEKREIVKLLIQDLRSNEVLQTGVDEAKLAAILRATRLGDLIEFSRAVHAEMDAIVGVARGGGESTFDATLYCTTYPCHNCARHIVAAGIREVVYVEPYTKSLAVELHSDVIEETTRPAEGDSKKKVKFRLFSGVAPRRYAALFERRGEAKDREGNALSIPDALHKDPIFTLSHIDFENVIADKITQESG
ncbi:MAG: hypothetical protein IPK82_22270 [Polyangiaceae bacterium]|nr:hypothetical protein [Polyangiaceae bacterium]